MNYKESGCISPYSEGYGVRFQAEERFLSYPQGPVWLRGSVTPHIQWVLGNLSLGLKRPRNEADHSSPRMVELFLRSAYVSMA
jgi:hypothetical protein